MEIRAVNARDDRAKISHIYEASWKSAYKGILPQLYLDSLQGGSWCKVIDTPGWFSLLVLEDGEFIGTSSYCASRLDSMKGYGEIISIYLLPEYCKRGYGKQLLKAAVSGLAKMGFQKVFLWVLEENCIARSFYEKNGFRFSGVYLEETIGGKDLREMQYVKGTGHLSSTYSG